MPQSDAPSLPTRLWTVGSSWFSTEQETKGSIAPGQLADLAVLSADYFSVAEDEIKSLESVLTIVGGKPVYATEEFAELAPPLPPVLPEWCPWRLSADMPNPRESRRTRLWFTHGPTVIVVQIMR